MNPTMVHFRREGEAPAEPELRAQPTPICTAWLGGSLALPCAAWLRLLFIMLSLVAITGCGGGELDSTYGQSLPRYLPTSVNGTDVLAGMFQAAGHEVVTRRMLITSRFAKVQTVVWFPNEFSAPGEEVCEWFDQWLAEEPGRTLVYVGRGYDAEPVYWRKAAELVPQERRAPYISEQAIAELFFRRRLGDSERELECPWFKIERVTPGRAELARGPWVDEADRKLEPQKAELDFSDWLVPVGPVRALVDTPVHPLVWRQSVDTGRGDSQLIVVNNGAFLLNLPLVNHEHRTLAAALVAAVTAPGEVVFLESGPGDPPIDPPAAGSPLARLFGAWPLNVILLHLAALGIIFCFARWPIFGRPRLPAAETIADFGKHVAAVGRLLARSRDWAYAQSHLPENFDQAKADAAGATTQAAVTDTR
jgi:hypothetical protein